MPFSDEYRRSHADYPDSRRQNRFDHAEHRSSPPPRKRPSSHDEGSPHASKVSRHSSTDKDNILELAKWPRRRTRWDQHAKGFEDISAEQLKLSENFSSDMRLDGAGLPSDLKDLLKLRPLSTTESMLMRSVVVKGGSPTAYLLDMFERASIEIKEADIENFETTLGLVTSLPSAKHAAYFVALPGEFKVSRLPGTITASKGSIYASARTKIITGLPSDATTEFVQEKFPTMTGSPMLLKSKDGLCMGSAWALFDEGSPNSSQVKDLFPTPLEQNPRFGDKALSVQDYDNLVKSEPFVGTPKTLHLLNIIPLTSRKPVSSADEDVYLDEVRQECSRFGKITDLHTVRLPKLLPRISVEYESESGCRAAAEHLAGIRYEDRPVIVVYSDDGTF